jgi:hypothetical protein
LTPRGDCRDEVVSSHPELVAGLELVRAIQGWARDGSSLEPPKVGRWTGVVSSHPRLVAGLGLSRATQGWSRGGAVPSHPGLVAGWSCPEPPRVGRGTRVVLSQPEFVAGVELSSSHPGLVVGLNKKSPDVQRSLLRKQHGNYPFACRRSTLAVNREVTTMGGLAGALGPLWGTDQPGPA